MENNLNTSTKSKKASKQTDNKLYQKAINTNTNKNNLQQKLLKKKYIKNLYMIFL